MNSGRANDLAIVLTGGGARAAYQVGVLRSIARHFPEARFDIITGVSAGAINALFLASRATPLDETVEELSELWINLHLRDVIRVAPLSLLRHVLSWGVTLVSGGSPVKRHVRGLMDTAPLRSLLMRGAHRIEFSFRHTLQRRHMRPRPPSATCSDKAYA